VPRSLRLPLLAFAAAACVAGCGYRFIGDAAPPAGIRSIEVGRFENRSREFGLDQALVFAFERELFRRGTLQPEEEPGRGDAVLSGTIRRFSSRPVAYDANDEAMQYEAEIALDLELRRRSDGVVVWKVEDLQEVEDYSVASRIVVPSTAQFQQGTLAVEDIGRLTDIQLAETSKRLALERLITSVVRDVHDRILDDF